MIHKKILSLTGFPVLLIGHPTKWMLGFAWTRNDILFLKVSMAKVFLCSSQVCASQKINWNILTAFADLVRGNSSFESESVWQSLDLRDGDCDCDAGSRLIGGYLTLSGPLNYP